jgi:hypothetical protein
MLYGAIRRVNLGPAAGLKALCLAEHWVGRPAGMRCTAAEQGAGRRTSETPEPGSGHNSPSNAATRQARVNR